MLFEKLKRILAARDRLRVSFISLNYEEQQLHRKLSQAVDQIEKLLDECMEELEGE